VSRLVNTMLDARELIEAVMLDFGLDPGPGRGKPHLLRDLARYLVDQRTAGRLALLGICEAQNLSPSALEEVRMLSNLETEKSKLIQIVLIGQPNLRDVLGRPELEQLRQRVTVRYHLQSLDAEETCAYINHRLRRAAIGAPLEFTRDVTDLIHLHSQGLPRKINVIADAVLLFGYGEERRVIDVDLAHEVLDELEVTGVITPATGSLPAAAAATPAAAVPAADPVLQAREARVAQRERQLAEQQRILAEEYRLLRQHREPPPAPLPRTETRSTWAAPGGFAVNAANRAPSPSMARATNAVGTHRPAVSVAAARRLRSEPHAAESVWSRLRRGLFGESKTLLED